MKISEAKAADIPAILKLQKLAYQSEAELYNDYTIQLYYRKSRMF